VKTLRIVATMVALTVPVQAFAQFGNGDPSKPGAKTEQQKEQERRQQIIDDKAYKDSLSRIPDREKEKKVKDDPWGKVR
jgi:hypothetical protein